jgi:hypothetical protein
MTAYAVLAERQLGIVSTAQLHAVGWDLDRIGRAAQRGFLVSVRRGVWAVAGVPPSRRQSWLAATLAAPGSVLSHGTAWEAHDLACPPARDAVDVLVVGSQRPRLTGVRGHRTLRLPAWHRARVGPLPVTSVERTLVDTCGLVSYGQLERAVKDAVRRGLTSLPRLARCLDEVPVSGRRKRMPIREVLAARIPGYDPGDSDPEADIVELLVRAGYPKPQQNVKVVVDGETFEIDIAWVEFRAGFEYDSVKFHGDAFAFHRDRRKWRALRRAGWRVDPITRETSHVEILAIAAEFLAAVPSPFGQLPGA